MGACRFLHWLPPDDGTGKYSFTKKHCAPLSYLAPVKIWPYFHIQPNLGAAVFGHRIWTYSSSLAPVFNFAQFKLCSTVDNLHLSFQKVNLNKVPVLYYAGNSLMVMINMVFSHFQAYYFVSHCWLLTYARYSSTISGPSRIWNSKSGPKLQIWCQDCSPP